MASFRFQQIHQPKPKYSVFRVVYLTLSVSCCLCQAQEEAPTIISGEITGMRPVSYYRQEVYKTLYVPVQWSSGSCDRL